MKEEVIKVAPPSKSAPKAETPPPSPVFSEVEEQIIERVVVETHSEPTVITTVEKTEVFTQEEQQQQPNNGN